jgi:hypothetical protein
MSWQHKVSVGLYRIALVVSIFFSLMAFLVFYQAGIFNALLAAVITFGITFGLVTLLNWILRGFIG